MANTRKAVARIGGSAYSTIWWNGLNNKTTPIAYCQQLSSVSPSPVTQPVAIQPLDALYPVEIITPAAIGHGQLTLSLLEIWNQPIWDTLFEGSNANDLAEVLKLVADSGDDLFVQTVIKPPAGTGYATNFSYKVEYHGCVISDIRNDETIDVTTMQLTKTIELWYRKAIWGSGRKTVADVSTIGGGQQTSSFGGFAPFIK